MYISPKLLFSDKRINKTNYSPIFRGEFFLMGITYKNEMQCNWKLHYISLYVYYISENLFIEIFLLLLFIRLVFSNKWLGIKISDKTRFAIYLLLFSSISFSFLKKSYFWLRKSVVFYFHWFLDFSQLLSTY